MVWVVPPEFPRRPERLGHRAASLPLPKRRVWTKGHVTHRGPSVKSPRTPSRSPSREWQGACRHPQRQHGTGQPSARPASAPGRRGTDDGQRQRPRGRQEVDGPAQPGDRGPPTRLPICQRLPFPRHKGDPATPPHRPPAPQKHTGAWKEGAAQVTARGPCGPRTASVHRQPLCSQLRG